MRLMIDFLNKFFNDYMMIFLWSLPAILALIYWFRSDGRINQLFVLICVPLLLYFIWATTGLWSHHEVATAFNRSAQAVFLAVLVIIIIGINEYQ